MLLILSTRNRPGYNKRPSVAQLVVCGLNLEKILEAALAMPASDFSPARISCNSHEEEFGYRVGNLIQRIILISDSTLLIHPIIEKNELVKQIIEYLPARWGPGGTNIHPTRERLLQGWNPYAADYAIIGLLNITTESTAKSWIALFFFVKGIEKNEIIPRKTFTIMRK